MGTEDTQTGSAFYIAVILYEAQSNEPEYKPLYQESFVLVQASSLEEARGKAAIYAQGQLSSYQNEFNETITWILKQLIDVSPVLTDTFEDGSELHARHFRNFQAYSLFEPLLSGDI